MPTESILFNEYGAAITPTIKELDVVIQPILREMIAWARAASFDGSDWAYLRAYLHSLHTRTNSFSYVITEHLHEPRFRLCDFAQCLRATYLNWLGVHTQELDFWEYEFAEDHLQGSLSCACAEIQIEKAMRMHERKRNKS